MRKMQSGQYKNSRNASLLIYTIHITSPSEKINNVQEWRRLSAVVSGTRRKIGKMYTKFEPFRTNDNAHLTVAKYDYSFTPISRLASTILYARRDKRVRLTSQ